MTKNNIFPANIPRLPTNIPIDEWNAKHSAPFIPVKADVEPMYVLANYGFVSRSSF